MRARLLEQQLRDIQAVGNGRGLLAMLDGVGLVGQELCEMWYSLHENRSKKASSEAHRWLRVHALVPVDLQISLCRSVFADQPCHTSLGRSALDDYGVVCRSLHKGCASKKTQQWDTLHV